jgi:peptidyl-prolyl cis-trans isomerase B (cyclophilin B)
MRRLNLAVLFVPMLLAAAAVGCSSTDPAATDATASPGTKMAATTPDASPATSATPEASPATSAVQGDVADRKPKDGDDVAVLDTDQGKIVLMFFPDKAPNHVKNFIKLAGKGFYDGTKFHRTIPGFMIQGGDPNTKNGDKSTWGQGGPGYQVKAEFNDVHHVKGILSMARSQDPDSAGSQFFIMVGTNPGLDGQYSAFGKVVSGLDVVDKIVALPSEPADQGGAALQPVTVKSIKIVKWPIK